MKFSANIADLQATLPRATSVIPTRSTLAQLENVQFDLKSKKLSIMGTDLEICARSSFDVSSKTDGSVSIPAKRLAEIVRSLPEGDINFSLDKTTRRISLVTAQGNYIMTSAEQNDLPDMSKEFKPEGSASCSAETLKNMISTTIFAASANEFRAAMMGVLFQFSPDGTTCVATDGLRLAKITNPDLKTAVERDIIVPAKAANLVVKSFGDSEEITINFSATQIEFKSEKTSILSRLIDEQYPNYEAVIPRENQKVMTVSRTAMLSSLKRVMIFSEFDTRQVRLQLGKNCVTLTADNTEEGANAKEEVSCDYNYDDLLIGFNGKQLEESLSHIEGDEVTFKFSTPTRACIIEPLKQGKEEVLMLVMPLRLNA